MIPNEEMMKDALMDLVKEAKESEMDLREYIDMICDDQFGLTYEEAVKQGAIQEFDFSVVEEEEEERRIDLGDIDVILYLPKDIARADAFFEEKDNWFEENSPLTKEKIKEFGKLYGTKAFFKWMSEDY